MAFYRLNFQGHIVTSEETFNFTVHVQDVTGHASTIAVDAATAVGLLWNGTASPADSIKQMIPTTTGIDLVVVDELDSAGRNIAQARATLALVGTDATESLPPQCTTVVSTRTALPTRAGRGRFYLPPMAVDTMASGLLSATNRGRVALAAKRMLDSLKANSHQPVIYHRNSNTADNIISVDVGDVVDTQQRRRRDIVEIRSSQTLA